MWTRRRRQRYLEFLDAKNIGYKDLLIWGSPEVQGFQYETGEGSPVSIHHTNRIRTILVTSRKSHITLKICTAQKATRNKELDEV